MSIPAVLSVISLAIALFLLYRTELRKASMVLRLLAAPDSWTISIARQGVAHSTAAPAQADYLSVHGNFTIAATNDGPRGGALWDLGADVQEIGDSWCLRRFDASVNLPYALPGRSCEGWSRVALTLACDFERLASGLRELQQDRHVTFRVTYACQNWRGRARRKSTSLAVPRASLLAGLKHGASGLDLATCQAVPRARSFATEQFAELNLIPSDIDRLVEWGLLNEPVEYITMPEEAPDRVAIRRASGTVDQGWCVGVGLPQHTLARICELQRQLVEEVEAVRATAIVI
jgi:hypothetical protein